MSILFFLFSALSISAETGRIIKLLVNGISKPIGYDFSSLSFSWIVESSAQKSIASKVHIALDEQFSNMVYNSKYQENISSLEFSPNISLSPRTRYFWRVFVKTNLNETLESEVTYFETGKMAEKWKGNWITTQLSQIIPSYFRKSFKIEENTKLSQARVYISALGLYELYINNEKVSNELFTPYCTGYKYWLQYQTYDVSQYLKIGDNVIGVWVGDGWAKGHFWFSQESADMTLTTDDIGDPANLTTDKYQLICELTIGDQTIVVSDDSWLTQSSPIRRSNLYDGEVYDCNYDIPNWSSPECNVDDWQNAAYMYENGETSPFNLTERLSVPVVVKKRFEPKGMIDTDVVDVGQNIAGWIELTIDAPKDFVTIIEFGEIYQTEFDNSNLKTAKQQFRIISNGNKTRVRPHFTYFGFQYIRFRKYHGPEQPNFIQLFDIKACAIYSDLEETGSFESGVEDVNKFFSNAFWSQRDNFLDVPTDCPQRDERMGWTGDAQIFCSTAMFNMRAYPFYRKYLKDLFLLQKDHYHTLYGAVSSMIPFFGKTPEEQMPGRAGWGDAATIIPFKLYEHTGRKQILRDQLRSMKMWIEYIELEVSLGKTDELDAAIWKANKTQFADWLALDGKPGGKIGRTEVTFICSCYAYYSLYCYLNALKILDEDPETIKKYEDKLNVSRTILRDNYVTPSGRLVIQSQTAQALGLMLNISDNATPVLITLKKILRDNDYKLQTGFIGTPIICRALSDSGDPDTAYTVFLDSKYPGWLYEVKKGATSVWESWDAINEDGVIKSGANSMNHYAAGSVVDWIYRNVCGIQPLFWNPGFKEFNLWPQPDKRMKFANCSVDTAMGTIKSYWKVYHTKGFVFKVKYEFSVPFNTVAHLKLINTKKDNVTINYKEHSFSENSTSKFEEITKTFAFEQKGEDLVADLVPGVYVIKTPYVHREININNQFV